MLLFFFLFLCSFSRLLVLVEKWRLIHRDDVRRWGLVCICLSVCVGVFWHGSLRISVCMFNGENKVQLWNVLERWRRFDELANVWRWEQERQRLLTRIHHWSLWFVDLFSLYFSLYFQILLCWQRINYPPCIFQLAHSQAPGCLDCVDHECLLSGLCVCVCLR